MSKPGEIINYLWSWESKDSDIRRGYFQMKGRITLRELIEHMSEVAPWADPEDIAVNFGTVVVTRPANPEELAERQRQHEAWEVRHEAWERKTLDRLRAKYGDPS